MISWIIVVLWIFKVEPLASWSLGEVAALFLAEIAVEVVIKLLWNAATRPGWRT